MTQSRGRILIIEDEQKIRKVVRVYLEQAGYDVLEAADGQVGMEQFRRYKPDLILLDLNLPGIDGMKVAEQITAESDTYIIMLTARSEETDRIAGLNIGADDYITKPFSPRELVARVQARLRRSDIEQKRNLVLQFEHLTIDVGRYQVTTAAGDTIDLTPTEFKLLRELATHASFALSREQLLASVWDDVENQNSRVVDVFTNQLRRKLEDATGDPCIETVRGVGYRFSDTPTY